MSEQLLYQKLTTYKEFAGEDVYKKKVPSLIPENLASKFKLRPYQIEAFGRYIFYLEDYEKRPENQPLQNLFHMATGSGKTLIMAGLILYLYDKGYRNFLFFVDSKNIIEKTKNNFLNPASSKHLFSEDIQIGERKIRVREVENFSSCHPDDINIVFNTIQGLHRSLNEPKENLVTYQDFEEHEVVLISDEAHHINAETKKEYNLRMFEKKNITSWEQTVSRIFKSNEKNKMLEFTATINLEDEGIMEKYKDKIIIDYPLKEFRKDGYSKEVKVLQADLPKFERSLQAILLSQYRRKVFEKYSILRKPVILFKSKKIADSEEFYETFKERIKNLTGGDIQDVKQNPSLGPVLRETFEYYEQNGITLDNLAQEIREDFSSEKCLTINSKSESEEKQIAVNSLEDPTNEYRAIFAVDKLNEGWDVLNLFDIVRLYNTRDAKKGKPGKTTMSEAQLIGRGARYCPFKISEEQPLYQRKYDAITNEDEAELKICEELYYHSAHNPRYIDELKTAMEEVGIKAPRKKQIELNLKPSFKESPTYKKGKLYKNERKKYRREDMRKLDSHVNDRLYKVRLRTGYMETTTIYDQKTGSSPSISRKQYDLNEFGNHVLRKALNRLPFYHFHSLKNYFPHLKSHEEFIKSDKYLNGVKIEVSGAEERVSNLSPGDQLDVAVQTLESIATGIKSETKEYKGTKYFKPHMVKDVFSNKEVSLSIDEDSDQEYGKSQSESSEKLRMKLEEKDWYAFNDNFGTSEEKRFVRYIDSAYTNLKEKYDEIFLIRNERHFKIYSFEEGHGFEPDFVLFLKQKNKGKSVHYQIFVEPKGEHLLEHDKWKEKFLKKLKKEHELDQISKNEEYIIWGLPFYNEDHNHRDFTNEFEKILE